ncbi:MAG: hypothetical protein ACI9J2_001340 [Saprospiraceae bacterium]|jgi:uncharacterized protein YbjT (DUF2867 family)
MNVTLFGATGFVGGYLNDALCKLGTPPCVFVRPRSIDKLRNTQKCRVVQGTISDSKAIEHALKDCECVIYNIGILREFPNHGITFNTVHLQGVKNVIEVATQQGVKRFILMSANGVHAEGTEYQRTKYAAEQALKNSGLDWTIFRPSVLFGDPRGRMEFATQLSNELIAPPFPAPLFFSGLLPFSAGNYEMSPAHVDDVAQAFVAAIRDADTIGKTIKLGGSATLSWKEIITIIARAQNRSKLSLPVPTAFIYPIAKLLQRFEWFPITPDQIKMLLESNRCDTDGFKSLSITPLAFNVENLQYLNEGKQ